MVDHYHTMRGATADSVMMMLAWRRQAEEMITSIPALLFNQLRRRTRQLRGVALMMCVGFSARLLRAGEFNLNLAGQVPLRTLFPVEMSYLPGAHARRAAARLAVMTMMVMVWSGTMSCLFFVASVVNHR